MTFEIQRIEMPRRSSIRASGNSKYPFADFNIGDCITVPVGDEVADKVKTRLGSAVVAFRKSRNYGKDEGPKFSVRALDAQTVGVWRVA